MNRFLILSVVIFLALSCSKTPEQQTNIPEEKIDFDNIEFTTITRNLISGIVECTGIIDVPPNQRAAMYAPIGGIIKNIKVLPGDHVIKGQILYSLSHQDIVKVQEEYLIAYNQEKLQQVNLEKKKQLFASNNISQRELREVERDYEVARANLESLAAQLQIIGLSASNLLKNGVTPSVNVRAPIAGYVSKIDVVSGSYVSMNSRIMTIVDNEHMHLELEVYADRISEVHPGQRVGFRVTGDEQEHWGEVYLVGKEVDQETRTVAVHAEILDEDPMVVGSYLYAGILTSSDSLWSVPLGAVVNANDRNYVVIRDGEELKSVEVETGNSFKNYIAIKNFADLQDKMIVANEAYYFFEE